jgi:hypothetical protein
MTSAGSKEKRVRFADSSAAALTNENLAGAVRRNLSAHAQKTHDAQAQPRLVSSRERLIGDLQRVLQRDLIAAVLLLAQVGDLILWVSCQPTTPSCCELESSTQTAHNRPERSVTFSATLSYVTIRPSCEMGFWSKNSCKYMPYETCKRTSKDNLDEQFEQIQAQFATIRLEICVRQRGMRTDDMQRRTVHVHAASIVQNDVHVANHALQQQWSLVQSPSATSTAPSPQSCPDSDF